MNEKQLIKLGFTKKSYDLYDDFDQNNPEEYFLKCKLIGTSLCMLYEVGNDYLELFPFDGVKIRDIKKVKELIKAFKDV